MVTFIIGLAILSLEQPSTESFVRECLARMTERLQRIQNKTASTMFRCEDGRTV